MKVRVAHCPQHKKTIVWANGKGKCQECIKEWSEFEIPDISVIPQLLLEVIAVEEKPKNN